jgi:hypothetical protein
MTLGNGLETLYKNLETVDLTWAKKSVFSRKTLRELSKVDESSRQKAELIAKQGEPAVVQEDLIAHAEHDMETVIDPSPFFEISTKVAKQMQELNIAEYLNREQRHPITSEKFQELYSEGERKKLRDDFAYRQSKNVFLNQHEANIWRPKKTEEFEIDLNDYGRYHIDRGSNSYEQGVGITSRHFILTRVKKPKATETYCPQEIVVNYDKEFNPSFMSLRFTPDKNYISYDFSSGDMVHRFPSFNADSRVIINGSGQVGADLCQDRVRLGRNKLVNVRALHSGVSKPIIPKKKKEIPLFLNLPSVNQAKYKKPETSTEPDINPSSTQGDDFTANLLKDLGF